MNSRFFAAACAVILCAASPYAGTLPSTPASPMADRGGPPRQPQFALGKVDVQRDNLPAAAQSAFSAIVVFGDSISDTGNVFLVTGGGAFSSPQSPSFLGTSSEVSLDTLSAVVNRLMEREVPKLEAELGITILRFDTRASVDAMLLLPEAFGLTNVTEPACPGCGTGFPGPDAGDTIVAHPDEYLWWDSLHMTRVGHAVVGEAAAMMASGTFAWGKVEAQRDNLFHRVVIEGSYTGIDGKPIRFKRYEKLGADKAFLIWIDGMGGFIEQQEALFTSLNEFPGGFSSFDETLADLPMTVLTLDLPGQGASAAGRVPQHVESFDTFVAELRRLMALFPDVDKHKRPIYLMGYSYGAVLAGRFAKAYPDLVDGVIMVAPTFVLKVPPQFEPATIEEMERLAAVYTLPAPNGFGLGNRCALAVSPQITGALAQCLPSAPCAACVQDQSLPHCAGIPLDFTVLQETWAWLQSPASIGCTWEPPPVYDVCTFPSPGFNGLTTDYDYCAWSVPHPLKAGTPLTGTFGNYFAMTTAGRELLADPSHLEGKPVLVLSTPIDPLVDVTRHAEFCEKLSTCILAVFPPAPPDVFYFHALLMERDRASVIARIRDFLPFN